MYAIIIFAFMINIFIIIIIIIPTRIGGPEGQVDEHNPVYYDGRVYQCNYHPGVWPFTRKIA